VSGIVAIVLAAGGSARLGEAKQLVKYRGKTLIRHAAEQALAAGCSPVIVILGAKANECAAELDGESVHLAHNPDWKSGMASSIRAGLEALDRSGSSADAVLFTLCDQPLVTADILEKIIEAHRASGARIVASAYGGTLGVPALFSRELFPELLALQGDEGARRVIAAHGDQVVIIANECAAFDIDTPEDRAHLSGDH